MAEISTEALMRLLAAQVPAIARRAVQVPTKMLGTVDLDQPAGTTEAQVIVDGADDAIDVLNATGRILTQGQRVVVDFYPPHGAVISGVLTSSTTHADLEQVFSVSVTIGSSSITSTLIGGAWNEATASSGWAPTSGGLLTCTTAGLWMASLQAEWGSEGDGTHRVAALRDAGGVHRARTSHQFTDGDAQPTVGYGLAGAGFGLPYQAAVGDTLQGIARQDSTHNLALTLYAHLRLLG